MKLNLKRLFIVTIILTGYSISAQDSTAQTTPKDPTYWKRGGIGTATFSQVVLENWAAGGQNSATINGLLGLFADYKKERTSWNNTLDLQYGLIRQGSGTFVKSDDKINLVTKFGYKIKQSSNLWYYSGLLDFRSQFWNGYDAKDSLISKFMAPGYLTVGLGIDFKPNDRFSFNYIPLTGKFTFVTDQKLADLGAYGVTPGRQLRSEMGSYFRALYQGKVMDNVTLDSRVELFSNYLRDFGTIDVNWQNTLVMKVNKVLTANFQTQMIYDKDIKIPNKAGDQLKSRVQFKRVFGVGLGYTFGDKR